MPILGIETATSHASVALAVRAGVLMQIELTRRSAHARDLMARIDEAIRGSGMTIDALRGVAVAVGPGSFTGVRVGMATAKGLGYSLGVGVAGLSTLEAVARAVGLARSAAEPLSVCCAIEAGRGEVYAATFRLGAGRVERECEDRSWRPTDLALALAGRAALAGDGAATVREAGRALGRDLTVLEDRPLAAGAIALWGWEALPAGSRYAPGTLGPNYVRPSDAEAARRKA
ncbi:MAG: tRNA (adenosine(37)-N6)-threonylcarbamoyltransferase complex dimerization subunit type 1 TsaB [Acidobacteriota bacterium]